MPWMLLNGSRERIRSVGGGADGTRARSRASAPVRDTWVLLGDLDSALYQAGVIDVVIERIARPHVIFAGGASVLDATLALDGRALAFRVGWERMRAAHVLGTAALARAPLARLRRAFARNGTHAGNGSPLPFDLLRTSPDATSPHLRLLRDGIFLDAHAGAHAAAGELVAASLREKPASKDVAAAIDESVEIGAQRVLLFGADAFALQSTDVSHAADNARARAVDVLPLPFDVHERPGTLGYVLPGLGRADRLIQSGREAARRWLADTARDSVVA